jgi:translation initiation factor 2A
MEKLCEIERANVIDFWLSPQGSYLATWERPSKFLYIQQLMDVY